MKGLAAVAAAIAALTLFCAPYAARTTEYAAAESTISPPQSSVNATYARSDSRTAYFCTSADAATGIFAVPYTYCVEVLGEEGDWYRVKYADDFGIYRALYGYVRKSEFTLLTEPPETVFLYKSVSVTFSQDSPSGNLPVIEDITVTAAFYGSYYSGAAGYSYVLYNDSFGYIAGANEDYPLILPEKNEEEETPGKSPAAGTVVAFCAIGALAVLAAALVLLSGKKSKNRTQS